MKLLHAFVLGFLLAGCTITGLAQPISGEWKINRLITDTQTVEYRMSPLDSTVHHDYGNHFRLNADGTFSSHYTAPCGNDCFTSSRGTYTYTDQRHIQLILDTVTFHGDCGNQVSELSFPARIGLFYIHQKDDTFLLLKSDGDYEQDQLNLFYSKFIDSSLMNAQKFTYLVKSIRPDSLIPFTIKNIASVYATSINQVDYEILYSKKTGYKTRAVLLKIKNEYVYLSANSTVAEERRCIYEVASFQMDVINKIHERVQGVNLNYRRLKTESVTEEKEGYSELTTIFRQKDEVKKVVFEKRFTFSNVSTEYYLEGGSPFYIKMSQNSTRNQNTSISCREYFIPKEGEIISCEIDRSGQGIGHNEIGESLKQLRKILE